MSGTTRTTRGAIRAFGGLVLLAALAGLPPAGALEWEIERVDDAMNRFGSSVGVAVAVDGTPHVANGAHPSLIARHAVRQQGAWVVSDVDTVWSGQGIAIALDPGDQPWLAYMRHAAGDWLTVTYWTGSDWARYDQIADMHFDKRCALRFSPAGVPHVAFCEADDPWALRHASRPGQTWLVETADPTVGAGNDIAMVLDEAGNPHIAHFAAPNYGNGPFYMKYTWWDGSTWQHEVVDATIGNFNVIQSGIDLDSLGNPHIAYFSHTDFPVLRYAVRQNEQWTITTIDTNFGWFEGAACSLILDRLDRPHVVYGSMYAQVGGWSQLRYAHLNEQGMWAIEVIDADGDAGEINSLALDTRGYLHVAYFRGPGYGQDGEIRYARSTSPVVCAGDLDGDGDTDQSDLGILLSDWGCSAGDCPGDLDGDGDTDQSDLGILLSDWGCGL